MYVICPLLSILDEILSFVFQLIEACRYKLHISMQFENVRLLNKAQMLKVRVRKKEREQHVRNRALSGISGANICTSMEGIRNGHRGNRQNNRY